MEEEEELADYRVGGYHPVKLGDVIRENRYQIKRKLGWGHFSTVWMALDNQTAGYVAIKIVKSALRYTETALDEVKLLERVNSARPDSPGRDYIVKLKEYFRLEGPNGEHICMVFEVLGENLLSLLRYYQYKGIPLPLVKRISKQVLLGLNYLHKECGIIHTDVKPENILLCLTRPLSSDDEINNSSDSPIMSKPITFWATSPSSGPNDGNILDLENPATSMTTTTTTMLTGRNDFLRQVEALKDISVKIADLGNATWEKEHFTDDIQTRQYRSPEVVLSRSWNSTADTWSFACMIFELVTGDYLFDPKAGSRYNKDEDHMAQVIELLGYFPHHMTLTDDGKTPHDFFNHKGDLKRIRKLRYWKLEEVLKEKYFFSEENAKSFASFLLPMLQIDPEKRADAGSMLSHPWLKDC